MIDGERWGREGGWMGGWVGGEGGWMGGWVGGDGGWMGGMEGRREGKRDIENRGVCMPSDAAYQTFWRSSFRTCVCCVCIVMRCRYFLSTCSWRGVCGCHEKALIKL